MLNGISKHKFYVMSQLVLLRGTQTAQTAHCAVEKSLTNATNVTMQPLMQAI